ncbi:MAG: TIGR01244 family phosphatase [Marinospirillum sp.]|uniref:TIGR01244 family sulfur transferase n=1 Tax=Marinospirillum sp. TaxID=2183934 RepID=UPI0019EC8C66|nr:TIGR01244 family sulfur transferase [Marinospirillum sp.]MBE0508612.1 TIGR01244 family phosphatase [Marinospirillum sp.]
MTELPAMRQLEENLRTCGQLTADQIRELAAEGVKTLIFNRPDQEEVDQPSTLELQALAESLGMKWVHQPVVSGQVTDEQGVEFGRIYAEAPKPVVAFCRTGARCGCLWALSRKDQQPGQELVAQLQQAGFDMPDFFKRLTS